MKYEHTRQRFYIDDENDQEDYIDEKIADGWELVATYVYGEKLVIMFRKPIRSTQDTTDTAGKRRMIMDHPNAKFGYWIGGNMQMGTMRLLDGNTIKLEDGIIDIVNVDRIRIL